MELIQLDYKIDNTSNVSVIGPLEIELSVQLHTN